MVLEGNTWTVQNDDWKGYAFHCWLSMFPPLAAHHVPHLPLLQNEIGFLYVIFRWAISLATKWLSIFKGLSTTERLKAYKMQFPSCGYKMPGPTPFCPRKCPLYGAQCLPFCGFQIRTGMQKTSTTIKTTIKNLSTLADLERGTSAAHTAQELFPDEGIILLETSTATDGVKGKIHGVSKSGTWVRTWKWPWEIVDLPMKKADVHDFHWFSIVM